ncbi:two-component sensor histidine kinase [Actinoplanes lobatus]|uniref:histidine kinase n=1 Tax=Actinoplanes lobatus TaxID=113568 RepID=A0A7W7HNV8_9ACTN|nr:sensor histidine kinase [Actinoplanes lobatus]MBB4753958.1 signal transduction histidine kinase [Actinoplanes lobatus]GGN93037.1 two-component sensor histidine kinase [Actinoplanes lobatus]GIE44008.1 two-component sensor histidine kinase [Actinoplanes lobatus]
MRLPRDAAVAVAVAALTTVTALTSTDGARPLMPAGAALIAAACAALLWRQRFPATVLAVTAMATLLYYPLGFPDAPLILAPVVALYTAARERGPVPAGAAAIAMTAVFAAAGGDPFQVLIGIAPLLLLPVVLGEVARGRARQVAQAEERAALAEASRENEALRRAAEERLRIARELHDVLAHQLSMITVQAGAALHTREPDGAFAALRTIRAAGKEALREVRTVLGVLRDDEPSLAGLPALIGRTEAAGLPVHLTGPPAETTVPAAVQAAAYRIVQEALTNTIRHAEADHAEVTLLVDGPDLLVTVTDDGSATTAVTEGNGLRGMTERATALGGDLRAGPRPDGGFQVRARIPLTLPEDGTR